MLKVLFKDSVAYTLPSVFSRGVSILLLPVYARTLAPGEYGIFDFLLAIAGLIFLIVPLEISQGSARYYVDAKSENQKNIFFSTAFYFSFLTYSIFLTISMLLAESIASVIFFDVSLGVTIKLLAIYIVLTGLFYLTQNQLRWELKRNNYIIASVLMTCVAAGASVIGIYVMNRGVNGLLVGMLLGSGCGLFCGLWFLRRRLRFLIDVVSLREMLSFSIPLVPAGIVIWLGSYADRMLLNYYMTLEDVGLYGMAQRITSVVGLFMVGIQLSLTPIIFSRYQNSDTPAQLAKVFEIFIAFALLAFVIISTFSRELILFFASNRYVESASIVIFLLPAAFLVQLYIFAPGPAIAKKTSAYFWISLIGTLITLVGGIILVPLLGLTGAALATLGGSSTSFFVAMWISQRLYPVPHRWRALLAAVGGVGLLSSGLTILEIEGLSLLIVRACVLCLSIWLIFAVGLLKVADVRRFYLNLRFHSSR